MTDDDALLPVELSYADVGEIMGISAHAVKRLEAVAMWRLRKIVAAKGLTFPVMLDREPRVRARAKG